MAVLDLAERAVAVPVVLPLVLGLLNVLGIRLLFRPVRPVRVGPVRVQGLIAAGAAHSAPRLVDRALSTVATVRDLWNAMDPPRIAEHIVQTTRPRVLDLLEEMLLEENPWIFDAIPDAQRRPIVVRVQERLPAVVDAAVTDIGSEIESILDVELLTRRHLIDDPVTLPRLVRDTASPELGWLQWGALPGGVVPGLVVGLLWDALPQPWVVIVLAVLAGGFVDWLLITALFRPRTPRRVLGQTVHGRLLARQQEASVPATRRFCEDVITMRNLARAAHDGRHGARLRALILHHVRPMIDEAMELVRPIVAQLVDDDELRRLGDAMADRTIDIVLDALDDEIFNYEEGVALEAAFLSRLEELDAAEFEAFLRPVIARHEPLFVVLGGLAGLFAGTALAFVPFLGTA